MKKYFILLALIFIPTVTLSATTALTAGGSVFYGKSEAPKNCPGSWGHRGTLIADGAKTTVNTFSTGGTINARMSIAQRRTNEMANCDMNEKQSASATKSYNKQYEKVEKKVEKSKDKTGDTQKIANQNLHQAKTLTEAKKKKSTKVNDIIDGWLKKSAEATERMLSKHNPNLKNDYTGKMGDIKNPPIPKPTPVAPKPVTPAPTTKPNTTGKTDAEIRAENDCEPGETTAECLADESNWDGKYHSAEEYERANGLR